MSLAPLVLLVEDEPGIADTVRYVLEADGFRTQWCATGLAAQDAFRAEPPALVILDVGLPDGSGFELFKRLQAEPGGPGVPMLFLTARSDEIDRVVGLELGADDYMAKPFSPRELAARVRTILRRSARATAHGQTAPALVDAHAASAPMQSHPSQSPRHVSEAFADVHGFVVDGERHQAHFHGQRLDLSRYELGILLALVRRPGRVFSRSELLEAVWDDPLEPTDRTVDAHIKTLRAKLRDAAPHAPDPIRTLRGVGYALATEAV